MHMNILVLLEVEILVVIEKDIAQRLGNGLLDVYEKAWVLDLVVALHYFHGLRIQLSDSFSCIIACPQI